ncbi:folate-binding protein [Pelomonas sp. CA6]|uniref:CAF17-like 4Fe-4S cluster assembly/insertion protein YgfZ n=1 Tax=Pelomonas sp. CA6 TaxID=2907999 RepID=UPI001F4C2EE3|nr:folate-binding protein [Pelomonas sp. CA6]MCH7345314.1 folate-binding protein [Pelomonas sp. CA6]
MTDTHQTEEAAAGGPSTLQQPQGVLPLDDWGVIRAAGEEAAKFLHGQLTQDLLAQGLHEGRLAGYCSAKGRLLALLLAFKNSPDELLLALPAELLPATQKRLSMFVLRAKCKLGDAGSDWQVWGLAGTAARDWLGAQAPGAVWGVTRMPLNESGEALVCRLPDDGHGPRYLALAPRAAALPALPALTPEQWQQLEVRSGLAWVRSATVEQFVPQMLNLELLGGVNFQKGCYPGQEIVARSQYRGSVKRRTHRFALQGQAQVGQELFHSADPEQPAGLVAAAAPGELLAEVKLAALQDGSLHLGAADGPLLQHRPLPYVVGEPQ